MRRFYEEVLNRGNVGLVDEVCAADYVEHDPLSPTPDREGLKGQVAMLRAAFPDVRFTVDDLVMDGDKGVARTTMRGTHAGELMGIPPTGKQVAVSGIDIVRFEGGKAVEHWSQSDDLGLMQQ